MACRARVSGDIGNARVVLESSFDAGARIEIVAQRVAYEVETQHGQHHGERGKQHEMWRVEQVGAAVVEHGSPTGGRRRDAESEKTHRSFGEDGPRHSDRSLNDHGLNNVGQDVANDDAQVAGAESARGFDEFTFASGENLSANQARIPNPSAQRQRENQIEDARSTKGDEGYRQQNPWEREKRIHQDNIDEAVDAAPVISGDRTDDESQSERSEH